MTHVELDVDIGWYFGQVIVESDSNYLHSVIAIAKVHDAIV